MNIDEMGIERVRISFVCDTDILLNGEYRPLKGANVETMLVSEHLFE